MNTVKKYNSFEELKSTNSYTPNNEVVKNRHLEFEKAIRTIISEKNTNTDDKK